MIASGLSLVWTGWAVCISALDLRSRRVPNAWFVGALPLAIITVVYREKALSSACLVGLAGLGTALALNLPAWRRGWIGGADVKAYALTGLGFGAWHFLEIFLASSLLFGLAALSARLRGMQASTRLAMLPALALSLIVWLVTGPWWWGVKVF